MSTPRPVPALTVLAVPDCPNAPLLDHRLHQVLANRPDITVTHQVISDQAQARQYGMHGSPTLLIDGSDPFTPADEPPSMSCRLYRHPDGHADGAPSLTELAALLAPGQSGHTADRADE